MDGIFRLKFLGFFFWLSSIRPHFAPSAHTHQKNPVMRRIKTIGHDNWYAAVLWTVYVGTAKEMCQKCSWHREIENKKKVNDYATPFLITLEDIKINLNKRHSTNRFETPLPNARAHTLIYTGEQKRFYHQILFNVKHCRGFQLSTISIWNRCDVAAKSAHFEFRRCYSLSLSHRMRYVYQPSIAASFCLECALLHSV